MLKIFSIRPRTRWIGWFQSLSFLKRLGFVTAPHAGRDNARDTTLGADGVAEVVAAIGAIGEDLAGIFGRRIGARPAIVDIGRGDGDFFYDGCIGIGSDMGLEAVNGSLSLVLDPAGIIIALAG